MERSVRVQGGADARLAWLLPLFVGSGCAALIYEVVWFQMLSLVVGSSAISLGVVLATFMGGMCLGSLALPRLVSPRPHPLRVYDVGAATYVAVALDVVVGAVAWALALRIPYAPAIAASAAIPAARTRTPLAGPTPVLVAIAISGATALGAEVVWTRLMTLE